MAWVIIRQQPPVTGHMVGDKVVTVEPPPLLSVHWGVRNTIAKHVARQKRLDPGLTPDMTFAANEGPWGLEPNWNGAMLIRWQGADLRVFPHEAYQLSGKDLGWLLSNAFEFVPIDGAAKRLVSEALDGETRPIYEAALLDGCTHEEALGVAMGQNILKVPEPLGWYRILPEYGEVFIR